MRKTILPLSILATLLPLAGQRPDQKEYIRANYAKFEYRVPMRDGVRLFTAVYMPNDRSRPYPGFYAATGMIDSHPALKAASPQQPVAKVITAFDRPCIPADCVAIRAHTPGMHPNRALSGGRRNGLGARGTFTTDCQAPVGDFHFDDFHHHGAFFLAHARFGFDTSDFYRERIIRPFCRRHLKQEGKADH